MLTPRIGLGGQPGFEDLLGAACDHVQEPGGAAAIADGRHVQDNGDVPVLVRGVAPHVFIHAADAHTVEPSWIIDQQPLAFTQDSGVSGSSELSVGDPLYQIRNLLRASRTQAHPTPSRNDSAQPSRQMRHISVSKSPTAASSTCETSSIKTHPSKADAWPHTSSRAYQCVPSPTSPDWAEPCASGRTHSWPTAILAEPATAPRKPSTESSN